MDRLDGHILTALEQLSKEEFKKFQWYLVKHDFDDLQKVNKHTIENADRTDTVDLIVQSYSKGDAHKIVVKILGSIKRNDVLDHFAKKTEAPPSKVPVPEPARKAFNVWRELVVQASASTEPPVQAPVQAPASTEPPVQAPVQAPASTEPPVQAPASTEPPVQAHVQAPASTEPPQSHPSRPQPPQSHPSRPPSRPQPPQTHPSRPQPPQSHPPASTDPAKSDEEDLSPLPENWGKSYTEKGVVYYINHITKTTSWVRPKKEEDNPLNRQLSIEEQLRPLPDNWGKAYNDKGVIYYVNHITKTTSWVHPLLMKNEGDKTSTEVELTLPENWGKTYSDKGVIYYINHITKTTSWVHPLLAKNEECADALDPDRNPPEVKLSLGGKLLRSLSVDHAASDPDSKAPGDSEVKPNSLGKMFKSLSVDNGGLKKLTLKKKKNKKEM